MHMIATLPIMKPAPKIEINATKCTVPLDCRRCLQVCPQAVFSVEATAFPRLREQDHTKPGTYALYAKWRYACTQCNECISVCSVGAISITAAGKEGHQ
ncbi:MAG: hypothetical protein M1305_00530 [Candidatus Marsarchaeota archaeon]|nr:hypothetical protein [Candidatus Marsarchaeota archaeon]